MTRTAAAARVVAGLCAGGANAIVNSDASSLLYRPAEAANIYTALQLHTNLHMRSGMWTAAANQT